MKYSYSRNCRSYAELQEFNRGLLYGTSKLGRICSQKSIRASSEKIQDAQIEAMVNNGAAVRLAKL